MATRSSPWGSRASSFHYPTWYLKTQLEKSFNDSGFVRLTYKHWDEHDPYYADQPYAYNNGKIGSVPGLDTQFGSIIGPDFGNITVPDSCFANGQCFRTFSIASGIHAAGDLFRLDVETPINSEFPHLVLCCGSYINALNGFRAEASISRVFTIEAVFDGMRCTETARMQSVCCHRIPDRVFRRDKGRKWERQMRMGFCGAGGQKIGRRFRKCKFALFTKPCSANSHSSQATRCSTLGAGQVSFCQ